jgi:hypothetical protein
MNKKYMGLNKFVLLSLAFVDSPVAFPGVPHNFNYNQNTAPVSPMGGGAPLENGPSKVVPGVPASNPTVSATQPLNQGPSPLDKYVKLFDNTPDPDAPPPTKPAPTILDATHKEFNTVYEKKNFVGDITEEQMAALAKGGPDGIKMTLELINNAARNAAATASETAMTGVKRGREISESENKAAMEKVVRLQSSSTAIGEMNKRLLTPAYKPLVEGIQSQLLARNPNMTAEELASNTVEYFKLANEEVNKPAPVVEQKSGLQKFIESLGR